MGDVIHALPALTDASRAIPGIQFDWLVEPAFAEIPRWHPAVNDVIPIAWRRWRKGILSRETRQEWRQLRERLRATHYDLILDAQGLIKSAFLGFFAKGIRAGLDFSSARESFASLAYQRKCKVNFYQHAVIRMRSLFSQLLNYPLPLSPPEFGLNSQHFKQDFAENYLVFLHATTWESKQWPESYWQQLADLAAKAGYRVKVSGGNAEELERAKRLAQASTHVDALPRLTITEMAQLLVNAKGAIAVDTGFGHLAAALDLPTVSIYGSTNPEYTGAIGKRSMLLNTTFSCSPCLERKCTFRDVSPVQPACYVTLSPTKVWQTFTHLCSHPDDK